jgi:uncharacterized protein YqgV (UPF0045/DUF77 family)
MAVLGPDPRIDRPSTSLPAWKLVVDARAEPGHDEKKSGERALPDDSYEEIRADFEALKTALADSVASVDEASLDAAVAAINDLDADVIQAQIKRRYAAVRISKRIASIEQRLAALKEGDRG